MLIDEELYDNVKSCTEPCIRNWSFELDEKLTKRDYVKMVVRVWAIRKTRRDVMHEDIYQCLFATSKFINRVL